MYNWTISLCAKTQKSMVGKKIHSHHEMIRQRIYLLFFSSFSHFLREIKTPGNVPLPDDASALFSDQSLDM